MQSLLLSTLVSGSSKAAVNDLEAYKSMVEYKNVDSKVALAVIASLQKHTWYLSPNLVVLCLADDDLSYDEKDEVAKQILKFPIPDVFTTGQPTKVSLSKVSSLKDTITADSWLIFTQIEGVDHHTWLSKPSRDWPELSGYCSFKSHVSNIICVNDRAERGIKLIQDYVDSCRDEELCQDLLLVAKDFRSKFNKNTLDKET